MMEAGVVVVDPACASDTPSKLETYSVECAPGTMDGAHSTFRGLNFSNLVYFLEVKLHAWNRGALFAVGGMAIDRFHVRDKPLARN
jgi:hypothetical protein